MRDTQSCDLQDGMEYWLELAAGYNFPLEFLKSVARTKPCSLHDEHGRHKLESPRSTLSKTAEGLLMQINFHAGSDDYFFSQVRIYAPSKKGVETINLE